MWFGVDGSGWRRDFLFYVENTHTLVAIRRGHALHPFERLDRVAYLFCVLCLNLFLAAVLARDHPPVEANGRADYVRSPDYLTWLLAASAFNLFYDRLLRVLATCACVERGGALFDARPPRGVLRLGLRARRPERLLSAAAAPRRPCGTVRSFGRGGAATAPRYRRREIRESPPTTRRSWRRRDAERFGQVCCLCADCCKDLGKIGLYMAVIASCAVGIVGCVVASKLHSRNHFFRTFVLLKLVAWLFEFALLAVIFWRRREAQRSFWQGDAKGDAYPLGAGYPSLAYRGRRRNLRLAARRIPWSLSVAAFHCGRRPWPNAVDASPPARRIERLAGTSSNAATTRTRSRPRCASGRPRATRRRSGARRARRSGGENGKRARAATGPRKRAVARASPAKRAPATATSPRATATRPHATSRRAGTRSSTTSRRTTSWGSGRGGDQCGFFVCALCLWGFSC